MWESIDLAVGLANSTLESIIKQILKNSGHEKEMPKEIQNIGSSLLNIFKNIEELRSNKTDFHGKINSDYRIQSPIYVYFVLNTVATIGLFLDGLYKEKLEQEIELILESAIDEIF